MAGLGLQPASHQLRVPDAGEPFDMAKALAQVRMQAWAGEAHNFQIQVEKLLGYAPRDQRGSRDDYVRVLRGGKPTVEELKKATRARAIPNEKYQLILAMIQTIRERVARQALQPKPDKGAKPKSPSSGAGHGFRSPPTITVERGPTIMTESGPVQECTIKGPMGQRENVSLRPGESVTVPIRSEGGKVHQVTLEWTAGDAPPQPPKATKEQEERARELAHRLRDVIYNYFYHNRMSMETVDDGVAILKEIEAGVEDSKHFIPERHREILAERIGALQAAFEQRDFERLMVPVAEAISQYYFVPVGHAYIYAGWRDDATIQLTVFRLVFARRLKIREKSFVTMVGWVSDTSATVEPHKSRIWLNIHNLRETVRHYQYFWRQARELHRGHVLEDFSAERQTEMMAMAAIPKDMAEAVDTDEWIWNMGMRFIFEEEVGHANDILAVGEEEPVRDMLIILPEKTRPMIRSESWLDHYAQRYPPRVPRGMIPEFVTALRHIGQARTLRELLYRVSYTGVLGIHHADTHHGWGLRAAYELLRAHYVPLAPDATALGDLITVLAARPLKETQRDVEALFKENLTVPFRIEWTASYMNEMKIDAKELEWQLDDIAQVVRKFRSGENAQDAPVALGLASFLLLYHAIWPAALLALAAGFTLSLGMIFCARWRDWLMPPDRALQPRQVRLRARFA